MTVAGDTLPSLYSRDFLAGLILVDCYPASPVPWEVPGWDRSWGEVPLRYPLHLWIIANTSNVVVMQTALCKYRNVEADNLQQSGAFSGGHLNFL